MASDAMREEGEGEGYEDSERRSDDSGESDGEGDSHPGEGGSDDSGLLPTSAMEGEAPATTGKAYTPCIVVGVGCIAGG